MKVVCVFALSVAVVACGGGGGGGGGGASLTPPSKELFSLWRSTIDKTTLDLTGGQIGADLQFSIYSEDGGQCDCDLRFLGDESGGDYVLNNCYFDYGSSDIDPGCNSLNHTGTYRNNAAVLEICNNVTTECETYR